jgi:hypothetical protein
MRVTEVAVKVATMVMEVAAMVGKVAELHPIAPC